MFVAVVGDVITFRSCVRANVLRHIEHHGGLLYELLYDEPVENESLPSEESENWLENAVV